MVNVFLSCKMSRPAVALTQYPIPWAPAVLISGTKRPGREAVHFNYLMSGAVLLPPLYTSVALKGTLSPCTFLTVSIVSSAAWFQTF